MNIHFHCGKKDYPDCPGHDGPPFCGQTLPSSWVHWDGAKCVLAGDEPDALRTTLVEELTCWMCKAMKT